ncbi:MAG TPA: hypothetical protein VJI75_02410 [Candidatus Nanoarchaeia archaeon]|nr:hypothetical protein [Candidatus Nanoarchaeia archaeon]
MNRNFNTEGFGKDLYALVDQGEISDTVNDSQDALASKEFPEVVMHALVWRKMGFVTLRDSAVQFKNALKNNYEIDPALAYVGGVVAQRMIQGQNMEGIDAVLDIYSKRTGAMLSDDFAAWLQEKARPYAQMKATYN